MSQSVESREKPRKSQSAGKANQIEQPINQKEKKVKIVGEGPFRAC